MASVSTGKIHRIDPATGAELGSFPIPVQNSNNLGLQIVPAGLTLHNTASNTNVAVPAGSLLVTNGAPFPDQVLAVNPTTGNPLASLTVTNEDAVAGAFHVGTGHLFLLTPTATRWCGSTRPTAAW